jgi:Kef-type K+ transport system membrane component KefB
LRHLGRFPSTLDAVELSAQMLNDNDLGRLFVDLAVIVLVAHATGLLLKRFGQPAVLGEILGGIALGPTLLGAFPGDPSKMLFPVAVRPSLSAIGNVGLVLFMFLVGLEVDVGAVRRHDRALAAVSFCAVALPFGLGIGVAALLYPSHELVAGHKVGFVPFAMFIATALSITAFPVLARILADRRLQGTRLGELALTSAGVQDGVGWLLLAASLVALSGGGPAHLARIVAEAAAFAAVLLLVVRPLLARLLARSDGSGFVLLDPVTLAIGGVALSAAATQLIGLHVVIGAFAFGLAFPRSEPATVARRLETTFRPATMLLFLPVYFLTPGLNVNLRALDTQAIWQLCLVLTAACAGKLLGAAVPARLRGLSWREAGSLGALLNARGLIELVVLTIGLNRHVLDHRLFTVMVCMAVLTTLATGPLLTFLSRQRESAGEPTTTSALVSELGLDGERR